MSTVNVGIAFAAGFASFISPCSLPLYPAYLSYITGISVNKLKVGTNRAIRTKTLSHTLFFILGFSAVFFALGYGSNVFVNVFRDNQDAIRQVSAIVIILMGLVLAGVFRPSLSATDRKPTAVMMSLNYSSPRELNLLVIKLYHLV
ncbi:cytochrome c biogenesis CcdA family protein [Paenibacillus agaridevorans]|uniref:cytochrome c biogenesis CcdA family protein n=1 Tax=Paenibacillus agaridevorans TaxID=171404 RepID=UPI001BE43C44